MPLLVCSSWVACSALCGVTRRRSAGVVATVVNGLCPFSEPGASSDPGWCGVSGAFALAVLWDRFAVQGWHCGSGANVALVLILQQSNPTCEAAELRQPEALAACATAARRSIRGINGYRGLRTGRHGHAGGETWFVRLGLRAQFARLLAAEMHGRLLAAFGTCAAANCAAETVGGGGEYSARLGTSASSVPAAPPWLAAPLRGDSPTLTGVDRQIQPRTRERSTAGRKRPCKPSQLLEPRGTPRRSCG